MTPNKLFSQILTITKEQPNCEMVNNSGNQPLNLITNIAFFISSFFIFQEFKKTSKTFTQWSFLFLFLSLGIGSTIHHVWPNDVTVIIDGLPIYLLLFLMTFSLIKRLVTKKLFNSIVINIGFFMVLILASSLINLGFDITLNFYLFAVLAAIPVLWFSYKKVGQLTNNLVIGLIIFLLGFTSIIIDEKFCSQVITGTHFLWHIFGAIALWFFSKYFFQLEEPRRS